MKTLIRSMHDFRASMFNNVSGWSATHPIETTTSKSHHARARMNPKTPAHTRS
jgi:hypothetical protein